MFNFSEFYMLSQAILCFASCRYLNLIVNFFPKILYEIDTAYGRMYVNMYCNILPVYKTPGAKGEKIGSHGIIILIGIKGFTN